MARKPGQSWLDLAQTNVNILKDITPEHREGGPQGGVYIIVSNPVDILTYVFSKISGLPEHQIMGSGTILDTSRPSPPWPSASISAPRTSMPMCTASMVTRPFVPWSLVHIANNHIDSL